VSSPTPLLAARGAGRRFGQRAALEPVELELWDGEALGLVGPNGAGKSTLLALLAGALETSFGRIERRKGVRVGWAPQRPAQYGRLSARENLELFARLEGEHDPEAAARRLLDAFDLPGEPEPSANLSVGNRQRLNLAIAQLGNPDVLLLDEPTAALDPEQRRRLWARVAALRERGGAVVFATQNLEEIAHVAGRVAALREGRLVYVGSDRAHVETLSA
jgi:ABC-2 type transport system ATP-binding protein